MVATRLRKKSSQMIYEQLTIVNTEHSKNSKAKSDKIYEIT